MKMISNAQATESRRPFRTRCISVELKQPVFHTNTNLTETKRERLFDKVSATSTRTAEVTVCITPERLPDRPRQ